LRPINKQTKKNKIMLKKIVIGVFALLSVGLMAQDNAALKFGHINKQEVLIQMTEFNVAQGQLEALGKQYETELMKMNEELQKKYTDLQALKDVDEAILKARQEELMALNQRIELVKKTANEQIQKKQETLLAPIVDKLNKAVKEIGDENGFMYIFDIQVPVVAYMSSKSIDVTDLVKKKLNIVAPKK
jgi:outer membrane protein